MGQVQQPMAAGFIHTGLFTPEEIQNLLDFNPGINIEFPDVSFYQGNINWDTMSSKTTNIIIRAGQNTWVDEQFKTNWAEAKKRGMRRHCYWFYDGRASPQQQWQTLQPLIANDPPEGKVWVDWEYNYGGNHEGLQNVVAFMQLIEQVGFQVGMYTGYYWFTSNSNAHDNANQYNYLKNKPLWLAWYTADGSSNGILIPPPWTEYTVELHQYGTPNYGNAYGCESTELDMNRVLGNLGFYAGTNPPIPPEPPQGDTMYGTVLVSLNVRRQPNSSNTTNPPIGQLQPNDEVEADFETNGWWHITKAARAGVGIAFITGECYSYEGATNSYIREHEPPVPPITPIPPQEVMVRDKDGIWWKSTSFTQEG